jgi:hypothetical protein
MRHLALALLAASACGHHDDSNGMPDASAVMPDAPGTSPDASCGGQDLALEFRPPNFLVVLDRSCSMKNVLTGTTTTKWAAAVAALHDAFTAYPDDLRWGMTLFPDTTGSSCAQDAIPFPVADHNAAAIDARLQAAADPADALYPAKGPCVTNIDTGVEQAGTDPALAMTDRHSYLMLVTDGGQSGCSLGGGAAGAVSAVGDLWTNHGVSTFVVGFGSSVNATELDNLAAAGGQPLTGTHEYYQADNAADLDAAVAQIAGQAVSCEIVVNPAPPDASQLYVWFDHTTSVPHDPTHTAGWDYDPATSTVTLYGSSCDQLKSHSVSAVNIVFGCPTPPIL